MAGDLVVSEHATVTPDDDLDVAMQILDRANVDEVAVVDAAAPQPLVGCVHERDVIHAWTQEVLRRDLAGGIALEHVAVVAASTRSSSATTSCCATWPRPTPSPGRPSARSTSAPAPARSSS